MHIKYIAEATKTIKRHGSYTFTLSFNWASKVLKHFFHTESLISMFSLFFHCNCWKWHMTMKLKAKWELVRIFHLTHNSCAFGDSFKSQVLYKSRQTFHQVLGQLTTYSFCTTLNVKPYLTVVANYIFNTYCKHSVLHMNLVHYIWNAIAKEVEKFLSNTPVV